MKQTFSPKWKSSANRRKQRKYILNAPHHIKGKFLSAHLSKNLRKKYALRSIRVKKGDKVRIMRGQHKNKTGTVGSVDLKDTKVKLDSLFTIKRDGSKSFYPLHPSNVEIQELNLDDKIRKAKIESFARKEVKK